MTSTWHPDPAGGRRERRWDDGAGWSLETRPGGTDASPRSPELARAADLYEQLNAAPKDDSALRQRLEAALGLLLAETPPPLPATSGGPAPSEQPAPTGAPPPLSPPPGGPSGTAPSPGPASATGIRAGGVPAKLVAAAIAGLVVGILVGRAGIPTPEERLDELAAELCDAVAGESRLVAAGMIGFAVHQAEELGFSGPRLGSRMNLECPFLYQQIFDD